MVLVGAPFGVQKDSDALDSFNSFFQTFLNPKLVTQKAKRSSPSSLCTFCKFKKNTQLFHIMWIACYKSHQFDSCCRTDHLSHLEIS